MHFVEIYDTTLRDGAQAEDVSFSVEDKLRIVEKLDAVDPAQHQVRDPRTDKEENEIDEEGQRKGRGEIDLAKGDHGRDHHAGDHADEKRQGHERGEVEASHARDDS